MDSNDKKPWYAFASSCMNIFVLLSIFGIGLIIVLGLIYTTVEISFFPQEYSSKDTVTPTATFTQSPTPLLFNQSDKKTPTLSIETRSAFTPNPTRTQRPTPTQTITCNYRIKSGDTLYSIAKKFGIENYSRIRCLYSGCSLSDPKKLGIGWLVTIPDVAAYTCLLKGGGYP